MAIATNGIGTALMLFLLRVAGALLLLPLLRGAASEEREGELHPELGSCRATTPGPPAQGQGPWRSLLQVAASAVEAETDGKPHAPRRGPEEGAAAASAPAEGGMLSMVQASQLRLASQMVSEGEEGEWRVLCILIMITMVVGIFMLFGLALQHAEAEQDLPVTRGIPAARQPQASALPAMQLPEDMKTLPPASVGMLVPDEKPAVMPRRRGSPSPGPGARHLQANEAGTEADPVRRPRPSGSGALPASTGLDETGHGPSPRTSVASAAAAPGDGRSSKARSRTTPPGGSNAGQASSVDPMHVCPGLVVPIGNECVLAVPSCARVSAGEEGGGPAMMDICEMSGVPMLQAAVARPMEVTSLPSPRLARESTGAEKGPAGAGTRTVTLWSTRGSRPLVAYCLAYTQSDGRRTAYVYDAQDQVFVNITKVGTFRPRKVRPCYAVSSCRNGPQLLVDGNFQEHAVHVTAGDRGQTILADTEPCSMPFDCDGREYYRLRVTELVDVGLMLCTLLAIDQLESEPQPTP